MGGGSTWVALGLALAAVACKQEPAEPLPSKTVPKRRPRIRLEVPRETPAIPGGECSLPPSWRELVPCVKDGHAYATGEATIGINPSLARSRAAQSARWALAEATGAIKKGRAHLEGAEVPEVYACEGTVYALARIRTKAELRGCGTTLRSHAVPPEGCPTWARGQAWIDGDQVVGVAVVDGISNPALAQSSARRRARHAASEVFGLDLTAEHDAITAYSKTRLLETTESEVVSCAGDVWGRVRVSLGQ